MKDVTGKVAFITGGASGVGFGMAKVFSAAGMKVVIADIRQDHIDTAMKHLTGAQVHPIRLDVTDRTAMMHAADEVERVFGKVHVVCNNAGINLFNDIGSATYDDWDWIMGVNLGGVINGVQTFVPRIKAHGEGGHVVNTASMASFIVGAGAGIYTASKFAVRGVTEALRWSLLPHGIGVSVLCPGLVKSAIFASEKIRPPHLSVHATATSPEFLSRLEQIHQVGMEPEEIGEKVLRAVRRNDFYIFPNPEFRQELQAVFAEALAALPDETVPAARLAFEDGRRAMAAKARAAWPKL
ncbi:MAG: SDR family NAD(P)-dependent oxidoreductase [Steroidobacteraceae bacterium]